MAGVLVGPKTYEREPERHPSLIVNSKAPFNAETPPEALGAAFETPTELFYARNHGPIPVLTDYARYRVELEGLVPQPLSLSMANIKALPKHTITVSLQCAGNRRTEMSLLKKVRGVGWGLGAVGTATWGGARLLDALRLAGVPERAAATATGGRHVEFVSVDSCKEEKGGPYTSSIPLALATSPEAEVLLAYEMNGEELDREHGFPLRVIVPGVIGARSVKWLRSIAVRRDECQGFFMQLDYKMFPPTVDWDNVDWSSRRPIMDFAVQSAITNPRDGARVPPGTEVAIQGYALSGGGRGVERVDVSPDGGATWLEAARLPQRDPPAGGPAYVADGDPSCRHKWAWVLWEVRARLDTPCQVIVRAVDTAAGMQPEKAEHIWNLRGVLNNSWHRIRVEAPAPSPKL